MFVVKHKTSIKRCIVYGNRQLNEIKPSKHGRQMRRKLGDGLITFIAGRKEKKTMILRFYKPTTVGTGVLFHGLDATEYN